MQTRLEGALESLRSQHGTAETLQAKDREIKELESELRIKTEQNKKQQTRIESLQTQVIGMSQSFESQQENYETLQKESLKKLEQMQMDMYAQKEESDKLQIEADDAKRKVSLLRGEEQSMFQQLSEVEKDFQRYYLIFS